MSCIGNEQDVLGVCSSPVIVPTYKPYMLQHLVITLLVGEKLFHIMYINNQTSQLAGKAYEGFDYIIMIAVMH